MLDRKNVLANLDSQMNRYQVVRDFLARADEATLSILRDCLKECDPDFFAAEAKIDDPEEDAVLKSWGISAHGKPMYKRGEVAEALHSMLMEYDEPTVHLKQAYELMLKNAFRFKGGSDEANMDVVRRALKLLASKGELVIVQKNSGSHPIVYKTRRRVDREMMGLH